MPFRHCLPARLLACGALLALSMSAAPALASEPDAATGTQPPSTPALGVPPPPDPRRACESIPDDVERLACFDGKPASEPVPPVRASLYDDVWELEARNQRGSFLLRPHLPNYLLPARFTNRVNDRPATPAADHRVDAALPVDAIEAKYQFSVKLKAWENIFGDNGHLWLAYTQTSNWQLYNVDASRAFRETNYQPEAILSFRTDVDVLGWRLRLLNLGFVHESNGRSLPLSRSWNRVYAQFGLELGRWALQVRPWWRLPEGAADDDNPDIADYLGRGDVRLSHIREGHVYSLLGRYSFSGRRGYLGLEWAFPISGPLKGYLQVTSGYGETLIDYNHSQSTIGIGLLLVPWQ